MSQEQEKSAASGFNPVAVLDNEMRNGAYLRASNANEGKERTKFVKSESLKVKDAKNRCK
jgi:hypothetical protein